jgi:hypothetical protein
MTPEETVRAIAAQEGVDPDLAVSLWQQESGKSTDTALRGQALSGNRGAAVGPFQVVPYYHPDFPQQGPFEDQARYALRYLKKVGPAGYYGTGQAPAGHPTTGQYVSQVMSRVPQDVRMAGNTDNLGMPVPSGDPQTGQRTLPPVITQMPPGMDSTGQSIEEAMRQTTQKAQPDLWSDPLLHIGLALLSQKKVGGGPLRNIARGVQSGMASYSQAQASQAKAQQDAVNQKLYAARTNMEYARMMGGGAMDPYQQQQGVGTPQQFWDPTTKQVKSVFFDRGQRAWFDANTQQRTSVEGLIPYSEEAAGLGGKNAGGGSAHVIRTSEGKDVPFFGTDEAATAKAAELGGVPYKQSTLPQKGGAGAAGGSNLSQSMVDSLTMQTTMMDQMLDDAKPVLAELQKDPTALGYYGQIRSKAHGIGQTVDAFIGSDIGKNLANRMFGKDQALIQAKLETYILPIARTMVEPKGPLANTEQGRAAMLIGLQAQNQIQSGQIKGPEQALTLLMNTIETAERMNAASKRLLGAGTGASAGATNATLPPAMNATVPAPAAVGVPVLGADGVLR